MRKNGREGGKGETREEESYKWGIKRRSAGKTSEKRRERENERRKRDEG